MSENDVETLADEELTELIGRGLTRYDLAYVQLILTARVAAVRTSERERLAAQVLALAEEWEARAGERSDAWRVYGPQTVSVPFAVESLRALVDAPESPEEDA